MNDVYIAIFLTLKNNGSDMTYEQACHIIDQFSDMGGLHVTLSGGEVFLHKDIIRILQYCRKKTFKFVYSQILWH